EAGRVEAAVGAHEQRAQAPQRSQIAALRRADDDLAHPGSSASESVLPSGSLNQAMRAPPGAVQIPSASCSKKGERWNGTPPATRPSIAAAMSGTCQPSTV